MPLSTNLGDVPASLVLLGIDVGLAPDDIRVVARTGIALPNDLLQPLEGLVDVDVTEDVHAALVALSAAVVRQLAVHQTTESNPAALTLDGGFILKDEP